MLPVMLGTPGLRVSAGHVTFTYPTRVRHMSSRHVFRGSCSRARDGSRGRFTQPKLVSFAWRSRDAQRAVDGASVVRLADIESGLVPRISEFFGIVI
jgi:hypothetical protein